MVNIGNGEKEGITALADMVDSLKPSPPKGKRNTTKTEKPITREEAAQLLSSALDYCKKAGLRVLAYNEPDGYAVMVLGLKEAGGGLIVPIEPTVTPKEPSPDPVTPK